MISYQNVQDLITAEGSTIVHAARRLELVLFVSQAVQVRFKIRVTHGTEALAFGFIAHHQFAKQTLSLFEGKLFGLLRAMVERYDFVIDLKTN